MTLRFPSFAFVELVSPYNKKNITRWFEDMNFMFSWQEQYLTRSLSSLMRYCSCHSNIKFISSRHRVISSIYYMASSASGQDEPNRVLWLATRTGKMEPSCPLGTTRCIPQAKFHQKPYNKSFIDQVCSVKMAGYWPGSFFVSLWTSTSSQSINTRKMNLANIQPSWPHTSSITHTYFVLLTYCSVSKLR